jgi:hypothetical protein
MKKALLLLMIVSIVSLGNAKGSKRPLSQNEVKGIIQAVEDEIYDTESYREFYQVGDNLGTPQHWKARLHIYIDPEYDQQENVGEVVYKFMPYGEILRVFSLGKDRQIVLDGDPHNRFPLTQPSHLTVYMDDEEVCEMKRHWLAQSFVVDITPTPSVIEEAVRRQKSRTGFSSWENRHSTEQK